MKYSNSRLNEEHLRLVGTVDWRQGEAYISYFSINTLEFRNDKSFQSLTAEGYPL
ncbi:MAG: hypothetical protein AAGE84_28725 [Cyanobacteria bacterium P01_G01_bin.39]